MRLTFRQPRGVDHELIWGLVVAALLGASILLPLHVLLTGTGYRCPFHAVTGLPCPTCRGTRTVVAMGSLHFRRGFVLNPLVASAWLAGLLFVPYAAATVTAGLPRLRLADVSRREASLLRVGAVVAVLANWAYLILSA